MILGSKPLMDMTPDELDAAIAELRASREALRNEALKEKAAREAKGFQNPNPKIKKEKKPKEVDPMLAFLRGEVEEPPKL